MQNVTGACNRCITRYRRRISYGRHSKWPAADDICYIVHDFCTSVWVPGRSVFTSLDHDIGRCLMERHHIDRLSHEHLLLVHLVPGAGRHRWSVVQHNCADHHIGLFHQWSAIQDVGHVLFCYTGGIRSRVCVWSVNVRKRRAIWLKKTILSPRITGI